MSFGRTLLHGSRPVAMVVVGISSAITSSFRLALHPGAPSCRRHVEFCSLAPTRTQELLTECSSGRAAPSEMVLQAVRSLPFSASPSRSLGSLNRVSGSVFLREAPGIVRSCELVVKRISLQQCQQVRKSEGRISLAQSYSSSAQSSLSEEACEDIIDPGLLARVAKLYRPVVILPGLGNNSSDYDVLVRSLEAVEVACTVVKVARVDWLRNVTGLLSRDYWTGKLRPRPVLDWYLEKVKTAIHTTKAGSADQKVSLIGHSAGGWLARVYMAEFGTEDISLLLTLGTPHLPPPRGVPGVFDQTRGLLNYVEENCPGAYHAPNVKYVCVAGRYVRGAGKPLETPSTPPVVTGAGTFNLDEVSSLENKVEEDLVNAVSDNDSLKAEKLVNELVLEEARPEAVTASRPTFRDRLIGAGYKQVCGRADVWGDGVVPEESAYLEGAINISLDGVYHSPVGADDSERPWYGSSGKIDQWVQYLLE